MNLKTFGFNYGRKLFYHSCYWFIYTCCVYVFNLLRYDHVRFLQVLAGIPLLAAVFYLGYYWAKLRQDLSAKRWVTWIVLLIALFLYGFSDFWMYTLMPMLGLRSPSTQGRVWKEFTFNFIQNYFRFMLYGSWVYHLKLAEKIRCLEYKLLMANLSPHFNSNAWNMTLSSIGRGVNILKDTIHGMADLQHYITKILQLNDDLVPIELEIAKLRSWIKTLNWDVDFHIMGELNGQHFLPMAGIELLTNALKYGKPATPISMTFLLDDQSVEMVVINEIVSPQRSDGWHTGTADIRRRIQIHSVLEGALLHELDENIYRATLILKPKNKL